LTIDIDKTWQTVSREIKLYRGLQLESQIEYQKFYLYSLITHSTAIEGSTLTELDTQLLFDDGITAKGKPLVYHLMNQDLKNAYTFAAECASKKNPISVDFLKELNAIIMKTTGSVYNVPEGSFDSSKGEFRLCGVSAGYGGSSYINYKKIPQKTTELCTWLTKNMRECNTEYKQYLLSFDAHYNLVTIHPWVDGNGRTARLIMNYIQAWYGLIPVKVYQEDKTDYISALIESRGKHDVTSFYMFMLHQLLKMLKEEIAKYRQ
jgi:Fic family protein